MRKYGGSVGASTYTQSLQTKNDESSNESIKSVRFDEVTKSITSRSTISKKIQNEEETLQELNISKESFLHTKKERRNYMEYHRNSI